MYEEIIQYRPDSPVYASGSDLPPAAKTKIGMLSNMHLHKEYELLYITSGRLKCVTTDDELFLKAGDILFINSYIPHSTFRETDGTYEKMVQFNSPFVSASSYHYITRFLNSCDTPMYIFRNNCEYSDEIKKCMNAIIQEYNSSKAFWKDYINANIFMLIAILRRCGILSDHMQNRKPEIAKILPAVEYINTHYNDQITTAELSSTLKFNQSYFCRLFKSTIGTTATEYLNFVRVCKSETMLKNGASISDAAYNSGFASLSYFNRIFKKYKHYTPSEFKKIIKNQETDFSS